MLYKFRDGINYLTFADKCEMSCVPIRVQKKIFLWYKSFECSAVNSLKFRIAF